MLAKDDLFVTGDPCMRSEVFEAYPCVKGLIDLAESEGAAVERLSASYRASEVLAAANALLDDPCLGGVEKSRVAKGLESGAFSVISFASPEEELRGAAVEVRKLIDSGVAPSSIFVAAPNRVWLRNISKALRREDVPVDVFLSSQVLSGDVRNVEKCTVPLVFTALALVAQPESSLAWRNWCGFGDYLASSPIFGKLREDHMKTGASLVELLEGLVAGKELSDEPIYNMQYALDAFRAGKIIISGVKSLRGRALLDALAQAITDDASATAPESVLRLCEPFNEASAAQEMYENVVRKAALPSFDHVVDAVRVGMYEQAVGLDVEYIILIGFVNGFFPIRQFFDDARFSIEERNRMHTVDIKRLYALIGRAGKGIIATYFTEAPLEAAAALNLKVDRIRMKRGERVCTISASDFLGVITGR